MTQTIDFWQLLTFAVGLLLTALGAAGGMGRMLLGQVEKRLGDKFSALEKAAHDEANQWRRVERELLDLRAELPVNYVRREDYIRGQSVIEAKLDGLALRMENTYLKGQKHD
jgi:hypothetical protein